MKVNIENVYRDFYASLTDDSTRNLLSIIHKALADEYFIWNFKTGLRYYLKGKKEFLIFYQNRDGSARLKIRLEHIEKYEQEISKCSEIIKNCIYNEKQCNYCGDCSTQIHLTHDGKELSICNPTWWWTCFYFKELRNLSKEDVKSLLNLINHELPFYKK